MQNKEYLKKVYRRFSDFVAIAAARELENLILDAKFTSAFSYKLKQLLEDINAEGKSIATLSVIFNTDGDIAIIDAEIVGKFVADRYCVSMEQYYKNASLNRIVKAAVNGSDKVQSDFIALSYSVIYGALNDLYMEIKCRKDSLSTLKERFKLTFYSEGDVSAVVASLLIIEDICKYIGIKQEKITQLVEGEICKK